MNTDAYGFIIYDDWVRLLRKGKSVADFFTKNYYRRIAVYGMGRLGLQLCDELEGTDIEIVFAIDRRGNNIAYKDLDIIVPEDVEKEQRQIDVIVVTPMPDFSNIERVLSRTYPGTDIVSIWDVVWYSK